MPICPECRSEYRREIMHCPTCDCDLVEAVDLPELLSDDEVLAALSEDELVSVARGPVEWCREVQDKLLAERIPAAIRQVDDEVAAAGHMLILQVIIRSDDGLRATAVFDKELRENLGRDGLEWSGMLNDPRGDQEGEGADEEASEAEGPMACPACQSTEKLVDGECPDCGLYLGEE